MPGMDTFERLARKNPNALLLFAMDAAQAEKRSGVTDWESRERGSLAALLRAYTKLFPKIRSSEQFRSDDIKGIHSTCIGPIKKLGLEVYKLAGQYRGSPATFELSLPSEIVDEEMANLSIEGLNEIKAVYPEERLGRKGSRLMFFGESSVGDDYFDKPVNDELNTMYKQLETVNVIDDRLRIIIQAIQKLERMHPFNDGNCRTFCLVLFNAILMQHDLSPAILSNPNKFDGYSCEEMLRLVKKGMDEVKQGDFNRYEALNEEMPKEVQTALKELAGALGLEDGFDYIEPDSAVSSFGSAP